MEEFTNDVFIQQQQKKHGINCNDQRPEMFIINTFKHTKHKLFPELSTVMWFHLIPASFFPSSLQTFSATLLSNDGTVL